jgi:hypothetical protein
MAEFGSEDPETSELSESVDTSFVSHRKRSEGGSRAAPSRESDSAPDARPPKEPKAAAIKRTLQSIDGLCRHSGKLYAFVRYEGTPEAQVVPIQHLHRGYLKELIAFYESHVSCPAHLVNDDMNPDYIT